MFIGHFFGYNVDNNNVKSICNISAYCVRSTLLCWFTYSLDLVKNRVGVMNPEMRKSFIGSILVGLIEKTPAPQVSETPAKRLLC